MSATNIDKGRNRKEGIVGRGTPAEEQPGIQANSARSGDVREGHTIITQEERGGGMV